jgi:hypothetical protein
VVGLRGGSGSDIRACACSSIRFAERASGSVSSFGSSATHTVAPSRRPANPCPARVTTAAFGATPCWGPVGATRRFWDPDHAGVCNEVEVPLRSSSGGRPCSQHVTAAAALKCVSVPLSQLPHRMHRLCCAAIGPRDEGRSGGRSRGSPSSTPRFFGGGFVSPADRRVPWRGVDPPSSSSAQPIDGVPKARILVWIERIARQDESVSGAVSLAPNSCPEQDRAYDEQRLAEPTHPEVLQDRFSWSAFGDGCTIEPSGMSRVSRSVAALESNSTAARRAPISSAIRASAETIRSKPHLRISSRLSSERSRPSASSVGEASRSRCPWMTSLPTRWWAPILLSRSARSTRRHPSPPNRRSSVSLLTR